MEIGSPGNVFWLDFCWFCCRMAKSQKRVAEPSLANKLPRDPAMGSSQRGEPRAKKYGSKQAASKDQEQLKDERERRRGQKK